MSFNGYVSSHKKNVSPGTPLTQADTAFNSIESPGIRTITAKHRREDSSRSQAMLGSPLAVANTSSLGHHKPALLPKLKYDSNRLDTIRQEKDS